MKNLNKKKWWQFWKKEYKKTYVINTSDLSPEEFKKYLHELIKEHSIVDETSGEINLHLYDFKLPITKEIHLSSPNNLLNIMEQTTEQLQKAVNIVTIKELKTLYKEGQPANAIELVECEEHSFDIVVQKGLYNVGDKAIYIQPDYSLPLPNEEGTELSLSQKLFIDFTLPGGEKNKSKLGKGGRIRAIKFNFFKENSSDPIYSMGVMLPISLVESNMKIENIHDVDNLDELLSITKYEEPETGHSGLSKGLLPSGMYRTDETNINNISRMRYPITLTGSLKCDGSSETIYYKTLEENGICSRGLEKKLEQKFINGYIDSNGNNVRKHYDVESNTKGWFNEGSNEFLTIIPEDYTPIEKEVDDSFVILGLPVLEKLAKYCQDNDRQLALRGELCGSGLKGSGNKLNPHAKLKQQIKFFGVDDYSKGVTRKLPLKFFYELTTELGLEVCDVLFTKEFNNFDEIKTECENYFKDNIVEGIVLRNEDCTFSAKYMNSYYDSKK